MTRQRSPTPIGAQIVALYDQLLVLTPSPVVALHRAVAVAEVDGPQAALALVDAVDLPSYYLLHAVRADLLRRLDRDGEAAAAYREAIELTDNAAERAHLSGRLASLDRRCNTDFVQHAERLSLFDFAGGSPAFLALATAHHARCLADAGTEPSFLAHRPAPAAHRAAGGVLGRGDGRARRCTHRRVAVNPACSGCMRATATCPTSGGGSSSAS